MNGEEKKTHERHGLGMTERKKKKGNTKNNK